MRIVVYDQDVLIARMTESVLREAGHDVAIARDSGEVAAMVLTRETGAAVLGLAWADLTAISLCRELRARGYGGPILILADGTDQALRRHAFDQGADDVLAVPYHPRELLARLAAISRRFKQADYQALGTVLKVGEVELSIGELTVARDGQPAVLLTPTEMRILECLMRNAQIILPRETLIDRVWGDDAVCGPSRVDLYIHRLRAKIERDPSHPEYIHTVRGIGYVFRPPAGRAEQASVTSLPLAWSPDGRRDALPG